MGEHGRSLENGAQMNADDTDLKNRFSLFQCAAASNDVEKACKKQNAETQETQRLENYV
jgi:hypothetical protein